MRIRAGTSGWGYAAWKGRFYPSDLPSGRMLAAYAARLDAVEANSTFYRMPRPATLADWREQVPEGFRFALKLPYYLARLAGPPPEAYDSFNRAAAELGSRLGPLLVQVPPNVPRDVPRLRAFLARLTPGVQAAFDFRDPSWLEESVLTALADGGHVAVATDAEAGQTPLHATADFGYLRLRRPDYDLAALASWARRLEAQPWREAFVFFKHEDQARGPALALELRALAEEGQGAPA